MKKIVFSLVIFCFAFFGWYFKSYAQLPVLNWAKTFIPTNNNTVPEAITVDNAGNVYTVGSFTGSIDLDPSAGYVYISSPTLAVYISKLNVNGSYLWAKSIGATSPSGNVFLGDITTDYLGNVYISGGFTGTVDFDPGIGTFSLTESNSSTFLLKLDASGNFVWAKSLSGSLASYSRGASVCIDATGDMLITGVFNGTVDFNPGASTFYLTAASSASYVLKLGSVTGNFVWAKQFSGTGSIETVAITADALSNVYVTGNFASQIDFDPSVSLYSLTAFANTYQAFVVKLNASGNFLWAKEMKSTTAGSESKAFEIKVDANYNVITTGHFKDVVDFDPSVITATMATYYVDKANSFISKLDVNGNYVWAKSIQGGSNNFAKSHDVDALGNIVLTGYFFDAIDLDPNVGILGTTAVGSGDVFVLKLNGAGNMIWGRSLGDLDFDAGTSIDIGPNGEIVSCGLFVNGFDFDPTPAVFNLFTYSPSIRENFVFSWKECIEPVLPTNTTPVANLNICQNTVNTLTATGVGTLYWYNTPTGGTQIGSGNTYYAGPQGNNYTVYVTDSTCYGSSARLPIQVLVHATVPAFYPTASPNTICLGSAAQLNYATSGCVTTRNFEYTYAPANWYFFQTPTTSNGVVNTSKAPASIAMTSSNNGSGLAATTSYAITVYCAGTVSFNWNYTTPDGALYDKPQYKINGGASVPFTGFSNSGGNTQSGTVSLSLNAGDVLFLEAFTSDNYSGACTTTITNFDAPSIPSQYALWYDAPVGGNYLGTGNSFSHTPTSIGLQVYYAQGYDNNSFCNSYYRAPVNVMVNPLPATNNTLLSPAVACVGSSLNLNYPTSSCEVAVGFQHVFAPSNWITSQVPATSTGIVYTLNAPASITLTSSNSGINSPSVLKYTQTMTCSGNITFDWVYQTSDGPQYDYPQYSINGGASILIPNYSTSGGNFQNGTASIAVTAGQTFSFIIASADNLGGACDFTINNLKAPTSVAQSVKWYDALTGGTLLGSTNSLGVTPTVSGIYGYYGVVKNTLTGCESASRFATNNATINPLPIINILPTGNQTICAGSTLTMTALGASIYNWSPITAVGNSVTITPTVTTNYTVTGTSSLGCVSTSSKLVTVLPLPNVSTNASPATIVCGTSTLLSGSGALNYQWQPGNINTITANVSPTITTTYTLTGTDANGCAKTSTKTIIVTGACNSVLNLKLYLEGYYVGAGMMNPTLFNQSVASVPNTKTDSILVELRTTTSPYVLEASKRVLLNRDGTATCTFNNFTGGTFYVVVKHRNSVETWSKVGVSISPTPSLYNFSTARNKAFGDNQVEVQTGVWAIYTGDIDHDGIVDNNDFSLWESDANNFSAGYFATDMDGDGIVDNNDFSLWENNANNFVGSVFP
jgi:hypothetical protein